MAIMEWIKSYTYKLFSRKFSFDRVREQQYRTSVEEEPGINFDFGFSHFMSYYHFSYLWLIFKLKTHDLSS